MHTSANLRFSGLTLALREIDSNTSAVLEFSLLTLTKNYEKICTELSEQQVQGNEKLCLVAKVHAEFYLDWFFVGLLSKIEDSEHLLFLR